MATLKDRMASKGMSSDDIKHELFFNSKIAKNCVDRQVPPPTILYWRVRAVFAFFGPMIDSSTQQPLFNERTWGKAKKYIERDIAWILFRTTWY